MTDFQKALEAIINSYFPLGVETSYCPVSGCGLRIKGRCDSGNICPNGHITPIGDASKQPEPCTHYAQVEDQARQIKELRLQRTGADARIKELKAAVRTWQAKAEERAAWINELAHDRDSWVKDSETWHQRADEQKKRAEEQEAEIKELEQRIAVVEGERSSFHRIWSKDRELLERQNDLINALRQQVTKLEVLNNQMNKGQEAQSYRQGGG